MNEIIPLSGMLLGRIIEESDPVSGWRSWILVDDHGQLALASPSLPCVWPTDGPLKSTLEDDRFGIGAYTSRERLLESAHGGYDVIGQVRMWGTVHELSTGYRAQFAAPVRLWLMADSVFPKPFEAARLIAARYGVECTVADRDLQPPSRMRETVLRLRDPFFKARWLQAEINAPDRRATST